MSKLEYLIDSNHPSMIAFKENHSDNENDFYSNFWPFEFFTQECIPKKLKYLRKEKIKIERRKKRKIKRNDYVTLD